MGKLRWILGFSSPRQYIQVMAQTIDDLKLISVAEAATTLNVSTRTVARLIADGQLVALKIRRRRLISATSIKQLLRI